MKKLLFIFALLSAYAHATTWNVNSSQSVSTIQSVISGSSAGDTVQFAAGTYTIGSGITLKCGVTYTGPVVTAGKNGMVTTTAILNGTFTGNIFTLLTGSGFANPCTQTTTIEYLDFVATGGIDVQSSFTNLNIVHNNFDTTSCCSYGASAWGIYWDGADQSSNTAQTLSNVVVQWNTFGNANSCTAAFADNSSPDGDGDAAQCGGMTFNTTLNGVQVLNNNFFHESEVIHVNCPGGNNPGQGSNPCEPTSNGVIIQNFVMEYNDFNESHRMSLEFQPQTGSGNIVKWNTVHNPIMTGFSFAFSMACCSSAGSSPYLDLSSNIVSYDTAPYGRYGYGIEAWGKSATFNNNLLQTGYSAANGVTWNCGPVAVISNNTFNGTASNWGGAYYASEGSSAATYCSSSTPQATPANLTGNVTNNTISSITSVAPSLTPGTSSFASSQAWYVTSPGYTTGPQPLGNTGAWCTTDNSTPVPNSGTALYYATGQGGTVSSTTTVKCVGMWGAQNQTTSYATNYGFVPSAVVQATYTKSGGPALTSCAVTNACGSGGSAISTLGLNGTCQALAKCTYSSIPATTTCNTTDTYGNAVTSWTTSGGHLTIGAIGSGSPGLITGSSIGTGSSAGAVVGAITCSPDTIAVTAPTLTGVSIALTGGATTIFVGTAVQACATATYSGLSPITTCGNGPDVYGTSFGTWTPTSGAATMNTSGLLTGASAGSVNIGVTATASGGGTQTASPVAITVTALPPASVLSGSPQLSGSVGITP